MCVWPACFHLGCVLLKSYLQISTCAEEPSKCYLRWLQTRPHDPSHKLQSTRTGDAQSLNLSFERKRITVSTIASEPSWLEPSPTNPIPPLPQSEASPHIITILRDPFHVHFAYKCTLICVLISFQNTLTPFESQGCAKFSMSKAYKHEHNIGKEIDAKGFQNLLLMLCKK